MKTSSLETCKKLVYLRQATLRFLIVVVVFSGIVNLSGCAAIRTKSSTSFLESEVLTSEDDSEYRRRARIRLELAASYFESGKNEVALDEIKQALAIDPVYADSYNLRGLIYMRLKDYARAENSFRRALDLNSNEPGVLHNYAWLLCQQERYTEAEKQFNLVLANREYSSRSKTLMAQGLCHLRSGKQDEAEKFLLKSYEMDALNPIVAYNLANLLLQRRDLVRAQFYIRRLNNSDFANAESLWLGIKVEHALGDSIAMHQLGSQLKKRFSNSREQYWYEQGNFNE